MEYSLSRPPVSTQLFTEMLCSFFQEERMYANYQVDDFLILIPGAKQLVIKTFQEHEFWVKESQSWLLQNATFL